MTNSGHDITNPRSGQRMIFRKTGKDTNGTVTEIESFNPPSKEKNSPSTCIPNKSARAK